MAGGRTAWVINMGGLQIENALEAAGLPVHITKCFEDDPMWQQHDHITEDLASASWEFSTKQQAGPSDFDWLIVIEPPDPTKVFRETVMKIIIEASQRTHMSAIIYIAAFGLDMSYITDTHACIDCDTFTRWYVKEFPFGNTAAQGPM
eukprot:scaffold365638_cov35-Attheya_sp.AAC.2